MMTHPSLGIDHCFSLVSNLDAAADTFRALGFTLSPRGLHSEEKGSANYTIMFPDDYYELLGLLRETPGNVRLQEKLRESGEGLHAIACRIKDARDAKAALDAMGIATVGLNDIERPVDLPGGSTGVAAFSILHFAPEEVPRGTVFMCQHRTPDTVWLPELLDHANTACGLAGVVAKSDTPQEDAERFARLWANGQVTTAGDGVVVLTGENSAHLTLLTPDVLAEKYRGLDVDALPDGAFDVLQVKVHDGDTAREVLDAAGIPWIKTDQGTAVGPAHAAGTIVEFIAR